ncbi:MAG: DUF5698 domain-containing protein [Planctomycetota bacterium]|jgi:uncharacterized protein YebE (UPF0316 family)|nr:DUF5698 domain-containing protein [Planctomycetota bacterium]
MNPLLAAGLIFVLRVMDMSVDSVRVISMVKGYRLRAALLGTVEAGIFIFAISQVLSSPMQWQQMVGYALGFGVGTFTGSTIAGRLASNFTLLRCLSRTSAQQIAERLRDQGHRVTAVRGEGRDGPVLILFSVMERDLAEDAMAAIRQIDDQAFVITEPIDRAVGGYVPRLAGWRPAVRR